ncbi:MAG: type IV conjugative transfer system protein TraE [Legionellales bacterium RIFCSPHIGHO2_12_FULL_37_14]|nr:MAG: type IV conjugative transfer system protein TraE [Legionellales bacterium RIFCSPHIGHO2_12_FULL_37_14]
MYFKLQKHQIDVLKGRLNLMVVIVVSLLLANILLASLIWHTIRHQKIEITPFMGGSSYQKSDTAVDSQYLRLMSENFLYTRVNVTPENVIANHKHLLTFVSSSTYKDFAEQLKNEASLIQKQHIASHINILAIEANPKTLTVEIKGILKRSVGLRELPDEAITYTLKFTYHLGHLAIKTFTHKSGVNNNA